MSIINIRCAATASLRSPCPRADSPPLPSSPHLVASHSDVTVLNNPGKFTDPYLFKITFECMAPLQDGPSRSPSLLLVLPPLAPLRLGTTS